MKHIITTALLSLCYLISFAETTPLVQSPNASDLGKYGDIPMDLYTGRASISIPIFSTEQLGVPLNINLSYDTGGMQMNMLPSWTGHGWTLNAGGCITRVQQMEADEVLFPERNSTYKNYFNSLNEIKNIYDNDEIELSRILHKNCDLAPDIYIFNFMGKTGRFFLGNDGKWKVLSDENIAVEFDYRSDTNYILPFVREIPFNNSPTLQPKTIKGFTLIDEKGVRYIFGGSTDAIEYSCNLMNIDKTTRSIFDNPFIATSWYLTDVFDRFGNNLYHFTYSRGVFIAHGRDSESYFNDDNLDDRHFSRYFTLVAPTYLDSIITLDSVLVSFRRRYTSIHGKELYPCMYDTSGVNVELTRDALYVGNQIHNRYSYLYDDSLYLYNAYLRDHTHKISDAVYKKDPLLSISLPELSAISIYYANMHLSNIFNDTQISDNKNHKLIYNLSYDLTKRMLLSEVRSTMGSEPYGKYTFDYLCKEDLPKDYLTKQVDHWGFFNGGQGYINQEDTTNVNNFDKEIFTKRSVHPEKTLYGLLRKIVYPTGDSTIITYEANRYHKYVNDRRNRIEDDITSINTIGKLAGGARVKSIHSANKTITYNYNNSGQLYAKPKYNWNWNTIVYNDNCISYSNCHLIKNNSIIPLVNSFGTHIGYSKITETVNNSTNTEYLFSNFSNSYDAPYNYNSSTDNINVSPDERFGDRSYTRGRLLRKKISDQNHVLYELSNCYRTDFFEYDSVLTTNICLKTFGNSEYITGTIYKLFFPKYDIESITETKRMGNAFITDQITFQRTDFQVDTLRQPVRLLTQKTTERESDVHTTSYEYAFDTLHYFFPVKSEMQSHAGEMMKKTSVIYGTQDSVYVPLCETVQVGDGPSDTTIVYNRYNPHGLLLQYAKAGNAPTTLEWDIAKGKLLSETTGSHTKQYTYNKMGLLKSVTEPNGKCTTYNYDPAGRLVKISDQKGIIQNVEYNYKNR